MTDHAPTRTDAAWAVGIASFAVDTGKVLDTWYPEPILGLTEGALRLAEAVDHRGGPGTFELNRIRYALGLGLLAIDEKLGNAARDHASDMLRLGFFSHTSPVDGKHSFGERAARAGTSASAENIAAGQATGRGAIEGWWYSPGHHKNMLGGHNRTGLGRADNLWTQMFGG